MSSVQTTIARQIRVIFSPPLAKISMSMLHSAAIVGEPVGQYSSCSKFRGTDPSLLCEMVKNKIGFFKLCGKIASANVYQVKT